MEKNIKKPLIFFVLALFLSIIAFFVIVGLSLWILLVLIFWLFFYLVFIIQKIKFSFIKYKHFWIFFFVLILVSIALPFTIKSFTKKSSRADQPLSKKECAPIYQKYNKKILSVSTNGLKGRIAIKVDENTCKSEIIHQYLFDANLAKSKVIGNPYMGYTTEKVSNTNRKYWYGNGAITPVYDAKNSLPDDPYMTGLYQFYTATGETTNKFASGYSEMPILTEKRYQEIISENKFYVIDGRAFIIETKENNGTTTEADEERAGHEGKIVKEFTLTISD
jgi:energy-coupling factor transporter transmembrane protein EcfT